MLWWGRQEDAFGKWGATDDIIAWWRFLPHIWSQNYILNLQMNPWGQFKASSSPQIKGTQSPYRVLVLSACPSPFRIACFIFFVFAAVSTLNMKATPWTHFQVYKTRPLTASDSYGVGTADIQNLLTSLRAPCQKLPINPFPPALASRALRAFFRQSCKWGHTVCLSMAGLFHLAEHLQKLSTLLHATPSPFSFK